ncbi:hypothetical protein [Streptomyces sasae]|uniref:hypothetical protein n=1 Tax=Streptomyces sasae TaxID=1266772 RepID=UPI00292ECAB7|nr:hypothetical protein [Streptomyces sasae]
MRNSRALAAACTVVAVLGAAAPMAVADGLGNPGGPPNTQAPVVGGAGVAPGTGVGGVGGVGGIGGVGGVGGFAGVGGIGGVAVPGVVVPGVGVGGFGGDGRFNNGYGGRGGDDFGGRGGEGFGGRGGEGFGGRGGEGFGGRGDDGFGNGSRGRGDGVRNIVVQPRTVAGGEEVVVTVNGCRRGTMVSSAFVDRPRLFPFGGDMARGSARIRRHAHPGPYDLTVICDDGPSLTRPSAFTVIGGTEGNMSNEMDSDDRLQLGGVQAGLGGSVSNGATPTDMAIGGGLVGAAVLAGCGFWLRRRHEKRF